MPTEAARTPFPQLQQSTIFLLCFVLGLTTAALGAALPSLRLHFELSKDTGGGLVSLYNLGALVAILLCGLVNRKFSQTIAMRALLAAFVTGAMIMGFAGSWTVF